MNDSKITKKHHPSGSLIRRILIIAILLLVLPLFLQSFFLYQQEYSQKLEDVQTDLELLASERAHFIEETVHMDWEWLEQASNYGGSIASRSLKPLSIQKIPLPQNVPDRFVVMSMSRKALLAGITESNTSALVIATPFAVIARDMPRAYPIRIALADMKGNLLWESSKSEGLEEVAAEDPIPDIGITVKLSVEKSQIKGLHLQSYYWRFATLVFFVGIFGGGGVFLFTRRIAKPLRDLCKTMERVSEGAAHARYTPDWMGFEINQLGIQFNETLDGLLRHASEAERERLHRERLAKEFSIGHQIQASLLPTQVPGFPGVDIGAAYLASKEVNGDFYDLFTLPTGEVLIAICDTAGKGISACLFALGLRSMIRSIASVVHDLAEIVQRTNDLYTIDAHESSMFATLWIGIFDPKKKKLVYCSQGHPPALLVRGAQMEELWTPGIAMGAQKMDVIPVKEIHLEKGDLLILYTDGITEAHNLENRLFGKTRLYEILSVKQRETGQQIADRIIEEVQVFSGSAPQHDDMTLLIFTLKS